MNVGIFFPDNNAEHEQALAAMAMGLQCLGIDYFTSSVERYTECDVAVVFGVGKKNVPVSYARGEIIRRHEEAGKDVIVIEKGYVKRDDYYAVGLNGLNGRADFANEGMNADRWEALGISLQPWSQIGKHILLCGQVPSDASVQNIDIVGWCTSMVYEMSLITNMPILYRPHPLAIEQSPLILGTRTSKNGSLEEDLKDAAAVVTYNSNAAVEAVIAGVPAFAFDEGSMAWPVANRSIDNLGSPLRPLRLQWAWDLAYAQWTLDEMAVGLPWAHLQKNLNPAKEMINTRGQRIIK